jgi:flagellar motor switch protein FliM
MQLSKVQILDYQQFIQNLPSPTHITIFKTEPLKGTGLLVLPPRMGITFVDRLLGGPGQIPAEGRDLTEIEVVLIDEIVLQVVKEWCNHWSEVQGLEPALMGHENNSHFLQTATPETSTLILTICVGIGEQSESIQLMFPYSTVEQLFRSPSPARPSAAAPRPQEIPKNWIPDFSEIKVPVVAEWADLKISSGEITHLKPGDLLMLDPACAAHLKILFNHIPKFTGRPGTTAGNWAVQLTAPVNSY